MDDGPDNHLHLSISLNENTLEYIRKVASLIIFPPFKYLHTLVELGIEPLPLYLTHTSLGKPILAYPSLITLARHISSECGVLQLYTGFPLILINRIIQHRVRKLLAPYRFSRDQEKPPPIGAYILDHLALPRDEGEEAELEDEDEDEEEEDVQIIEVGGNDDNENNGESDVDDLEDIIESREPRSREDSDLMISSSSSDIFSSEVSASTELADFFSDLFKNIFRTTCIRVTSLLLSYPFEVLYIRRCAQYFGKEVIYSSIFSGVRDIYKHEGILGFYSGFIPRVFVDLLGIAFTQTFYSVLIKPCVRRSSVRFFFYKYADTFADYKAFPLKLVSVIMSVKPCHRLAASKLEPEFPTWTSCWRYLHSTGQLRRGSQIFWRYQRQLSVNEYLLRNPSLIDVTI